jgi:hypothetical protein
MKRWLARVGWEMQTRRDERDDKKDLLATKDDVEKWLQQAIAEERGEKGSHEEAQRFLDHIARRSGLLIPRGPEDFAFAHLTFQEYFAACHLGELAFDLEVLTNECAPRVEQRYWHETLCVLFEILAKKFRGAADRLFEKLYETVPQPNATESDEARARRQSAAELFSELLLDEQNGLTPGKRKIAADFTLAEISRNHNYKVIESLKLLPSYRCGELIVTWFDEQLQTTSPAQFGLHFFVVGNELLDDWPQRLTAWVQGNPQRQLDDLQIAQIALFATGDNKSYRQICPWAVDKMSLLRWLSPINYWLDYGALSLADAYRKEIEEMTEISVQLQLLLEAHTLSAMRKGQVLRLTTAIFDPDSDRARARARALDRARALAASLAGAISSPRPATQHLPATTKVEELLFAPEASAQQYNASRAAMQQLASASNDWARLQGVTALLSMGAGTPELLAEQNALIKKGVKQPHQFTFPAALHAETETEEFRAQMPDLFKLIFLHDPDDPETHWLQPEFFDPARPESKYFLSNPREFFILAADALDPNGKTELGQWRRGKTLA